MIELYPTLGTAYRLKVLFHERWKMPGKEAATAFLTNGCDAVEKAKIPAFIAFSNTVRAHWRWHHSLRRIQRSVQIIRVFMDENELCLVCYKNITPKSAARLFSSTGFFCYVFLFCIYL